MQALWSLARDLPRSACSCSSSGSASLGAEIAAARLMAPFFGASTIVWANTIGVVLVSLSIGYWVGGRFADRHPHQRGLCTLVLVAALAVGLDPLRRRPVPRRLGRRARRASRRAPSSARWSPVHRAGRSARDAARRGLAVRDPARRRAVEESGTVAGRLYAISTVGSLAGTFASALLLIPLVGTRRTFLVFGLACALVAVPGVAPAAAAVAVPAAIVVLLALPVGTIKASERRQGAGGGRDASTSTRAWSRSPTATRKLELNEGQAVHSLYRPGSYLTGDYWDEFLVLPFAARSSAAAERRDPRQRRRHDGARARPLLPATRRSTPSRSTAS